MRSQSPSRGKQRDGSTGSGSVIRTLHRSDCDHIPPVEIEIAATGEIISVPDYAGIAKYYAELVASKRMPTNRLLVLAAQRYLRMLEMAEDPNCEFYFSVEDLTHFCMFSERLQHFEGGNWESTQVSGETGQPDPSIYLEPFEIWIEANAQGFRRRLNGARLLQTVVEIIPRKHGKALALDTPIPTPTGWTTMGEVKVGDFVIGADGKPAQVVDESPVYTDHQCYRVTFSNGEQIVADAGHRWLTTARVNELGKRSGRDMPRFKGPTLTKRYCGRYEYWMARFWKQPERPIGRVGVDEEIKVRALFEELAKADLEQFPITGNVTTRVRTTEELLQTLTFGARGDRNHSIAMPAPLRGISADLPIDPYVLGVWLGDGDTDNTQITAGSEDVEEMVNNLSGLGLDLSTKKDRGAWRIRLHPLMHDVGLFSYFKGLEKGKRKSAKDIFRKAGVLGNKHIPAQYLRASFEQRLALLQGLMDSDGTIDKKGIQMSFSTILPALRDGFCELLSTFGIKYSVLESQNVCNGRIVDGVHWNVTFCTKRDLVPAFRLKRKLDRMRSTATDKTSARCRTVQIVSIEPVESVPVKCISVENEDHLFLVGRTMIPTHNSLRGTRAALYDLCCGGIKGAEIPVAARDAEQAKKTLFGDIQKMVNADEELRDTYGLKVTREAVQGPNGSIFPLTGLSDKIDGLNPSLALFDEAHAGSSAVYKVIESAFGARPGQQMRVISTAGQRPEGPAFELIQKARMILEGGLESYTFFAAIYTLDPEDYQHPETKLIMWDKLLNDENLIMKCNPMYGVSLDPMSIREAVSSGYKLSPEKRGEIARTRFNIWSSAGVALIDPTHWSNCYDRKLDLSMFIGQKCWIGVDLAQYHDMCAIILMFELPNDAIAVFGQFYLPEDSKTTQNAELADHIAMWSEDGHLYLTEGSLADHDRVRRDVEVFCEMFDVQVIACDPYQAHNTVKHLYDGKRPVMVFPNNAKTMTAPTDDLLGRIETKRVLHDGNPVLSWHIQNVHGDRKPNGSILPRKDKDDSPRKIDGFVAMCFANGCRMNPEEAKPVGEATSEGVDPYQTRGLINFDLGGL